MKLILENWQSFVNEQEIESMIEEDLIHEDELDEVRNPFESAKSNLPNIFYPNYKDKGIEGIKRFIANIKAKKRPFYSKFDQLTSEQQKAYQAIADKQLQIAKADLKVAMAKEQPQANQPEQQQKIAKAEDRIEKAQGNLDAQVDKLAASGGAPSPENFKKLFATENINDYLDVYTQIADEEQTKVIKQVIAALMKLKGKPKEEVSAPIKELSKKISNLEITEEIAKSLENNTPQRHLADIIVKELDLADQTKGGESDQPNQPDIVDPNDETLQLIKTTYTNFKDNFYDKSKTQGLKGQSELVSKFLVALKAFATAEQKAAALGRASDSKQPSGKRDDLTEMEVAPKNIKVLKTRIRNFQRALRASEQYIQIYQQKLADNKKMVAADRDKLVGIAEKTQQTIMGLNKAINGILGIAKKQEEQQPINEQTAGQKFFAMLEEIEAVYDELTKGDMLQIMSKLGNTEMQWAEVKPVIQSALEELNKIKKYFPQVVPFEGSEVESAEMLKRYKEAIKQIDLDASDIQTLPDEITSDEGSAILINFQSKLIDLSEELQKIFGVKGVEARKDSAKAKNVVPADAGAAPVDDEQETDESGIDEKKLESIKNKYSGHPFIEQLRPEEKESFSHYLYFLQESGVSLSTPFNKKQEQNENIEELFDEESVGPKFKEAFIKLKEFNANYANKVSQWLGRESRRTQFMNMFTGKAPRKNFEVKSYQDFMKVFKTKKDISYEKMKTKMKSRFELTPGAYEGLIKFVALLRNKEPKKQKVDELQITPAQIGKVVPIPDNIDVIKLVKLFKQKAGKKQHYREFMKLWESDDFTASDLRFFIEVLLSRLKDYKIQFRMNSYILSQILFDDGMGDETGEKTQADLAQTASQRGGATGSPGQGAKNQTANLEEILTKKLIPAIKQQLRGE